MSLKDPDDDLDELVPQKRKGKMGKVAHNSKIFLFVLIVGLILGGFATHYFVEPLLIEAESSTCKDCLATKELLGRENDCLYTLVSDAKTAIASCTNLADEAQVTSDNFPLTGSDADNNSPTAPDINVDDLGDNEVS